MRINLSPVIMDAMLTVTKAGDILTINGVQYDFSVLPDGATLPVRWEEGPDGEPVFIDAVGCPMIRHDVHRVGGDLHVTLTLPCGYAASEAARFPAPIINPADGPITLPE